MLTIETIEKINREVNREIWPIPDDKKYSKREYWTDAELEGDGEGDCEDYCIAKRRRLVDAGFDRDTMSIAVVKTDEGLGHAILIIDFDSKQLALDNLRDDVLLWNETGYKFVMIETAAKDGSGNRIWRRVVA